MRGAGRPEHLPVGLRPPAGLHEGRQGRAGGLRLRREQHRRRVPVLRRRRGHRPAGCRHGPRERRRPVPHGSGPARHAGRQPLRMGTRPLRSRRLGTALTGSGVEPLRSPPEPEAAPSRQTLEQELGVHPAAEPEPMPAIPADSPGANPPRRRARAVERRRTQGQRRLPDSHRRAGPEGDRSPLPGKRLMSHPWGLVHLGRMRPGRAVRSLRPTRPTRPTRAAALSGQSVRGGEGPPAGGVVAGGVG